MKQKGIITGILFVVLLAFVFQTEISGFFADVRDKAFTAANEEQLTETAALPEYEESEAATVEETKGEAPPTANSAEAAAAEVTYKEVSLYFVNKEANELAVETRSIVNQTGIAKTTLQELLTGPVDTTLASYIPKDTTVQSINIQDNGVCTVDFSEELKTAELNSTEEKYVIESIVNTLSQFDAINSVQIRIDGNNIESIAGHWDISKPLAAK